MQAIIIDNQTDWGGNFKLHIQSRVITGSSYIYGLCSNHESSKVGFELEIPVHTDKFGTGVILRSLGDISNNFLKTLYDIYGLHLQENLIFTKATSCNYTGLNDLTFKGDGQRKLETVNYLKVFFEGNDENEYAELYLNIDDTNKIIEFEEKSYEYRPYIAYFLTAE